MITIRSDGIAEAIATLGDVAKPDAFNRVILNLSQVAFDAMEKGADRHTKTGALFRSVYNRPIPGEKIGREVGHDPSTLTVKSKGQEINRAIFVLLGTRPNDSIKPKDKKALRWVSGERFLFARSVKHPGYVGDNYLEAAAREAVAQFQRIVDESLRG